MTENQHLQQQRERDQTLLYAEPAYASRIDGLILLLG